ncbi:cytochrome C [Undibacterium sp. SXout7W]|uniref:cytochrome C n=1 Tax=Undibacterium sp. SXout7W TaxID=3413049 RepID=UPI003BF14F72
MFASYKKSDFTTSTVATISKLGKVSKMNNGLSCAALLLLSACGGSSDMVADKTINTPAAPPIIVGSSLLISDAEPLPPASAPASADVTIPVLQPNEEGSALTFSTTGSIDRSNPFFKPFGNGRSCATCHQETQGWSLRPALVQERFNVTNGNDPLFNLNDGANSPVAVATTLDQKRLAYSMLLSKGLIRVGLGVPTEAEFTLDKIDDPYRFATAKELSLFRRPMPTTNLKFLSTVMWDGRETFTDAKSNVCITGSRPLRCFATIDTDLLHQSVSAVTGHAQAAQGLTSNEQRSIVDFEKTLFTTQMISKDAGNLNDLGAKGGPQELSKNDYYFGINDVQDGDYKTSAPFNRNVMSLFASWRGLDRPAPPNPPIPVRVAVPAPSAQDQARASIARGEQLFNNRPFNIVRVNGFNDELRVPLQRGTCTSCHSVPNVGSHSIPRLFNTGVSDVALRTADLPLYTLKNKTTGEVVQTTDPGAAMTTGKWSDIGRFKVPSLRGIEARSPYFHNGSIVDLTDVVKFYDKRFAIGLTPQEIADMTAFLKAL